MWVQLPCFGSTHRFTTKLEDLVKLCVERVHSSKKHGYMPRNRHKNPLRTSRCALPSGDSIHATRALARPHILGSASPRVEFRSEVQDRRLPSILLIQVVAVLTWKRAVKLWSTVIRSTSHHRPATALPLHICSGRQREGLQGLPDYLDRPLFLVVFYSQSTSASQRLLDTPPQAASS